MYRILLLALFIVSCGKQYKSKIFDDCTCNTFSIENGIQVNDLFKNYSITIPDSSWFPESDNDPEGTCVFVAKSINEEIYAATFCQFMKTKPWPSLDEQLTEIETNFNVLESGSLNIDSLNGFWHLVLNEDSTTSLQITLSNNEDKTFFSLSTLSVNSSSSSKEALCKIEPIIYSFKRNENSDDLQLNYSKKVKYINQ